MSKFFWLILGLTVAGLIGGFLLFGNNSSQSTPNIDNPHQVTAEDHVTGNPDAKVTLIEYGDFQCPACKSAEPMVQQVNREYSKRIRFVFRHYPLTAIHPNAFAAARAAEAAGHFDKFFEMHDLLYDKQDEWAKSSQAQKLFRDYATQLGINVEQFTEAYNLAETTDHINADVKIGQHLEIESTPTFFLNGQKLEPGPRSYKELKAKIDAALAKS